MAIRPEIVKLIDKYSQKRGLWLVRRALFPPALTVQGNSISLGTGQNSYSAIDTGTTLTGGPQSAVAEIYANVPDSSPGTGNWDGYYTYI